ncbi:MAG: hypothetical protein OEL77_04305 [Nitrosopumilus sp.]|nr:hypothetical protein [Nitrosopumilus sp.]MDH3385219.1 hypothetical protein [Nitrosopumilus sp.]
MGFICNRCNCESNEGTDRKLICEDCKIQLDLLDKETRVNDERIKKLEEHKKLELENPTTEETMRRIEWNLKMEYNKRDGIIKTINSKDKF